MQQSKMNTALNLKTQTAPLTVSQLTARIRSVLEETFLDVAVVGEVSNFKPHSSGHWYFSLKDLNATLPCACFRNANSAVRFDLQDGLKVVARGRLEVYPPRGGYQLIVTSLEPVGIGQWQLAFDQLKERLEREGLLDLDRKRNIPLMPRKIGIVTSPTAAALQDILTALHRRNPNVHVVIAPTRVQGDGVEHEIAQAIRDIQQVPDIEVIIVARGGGSIEDLWCFNTEAVARAVSTSIIPVISGIGHETDVTICDLVADLRAPTPTAAAELVCRGHAEMTQRWTNLQRLLLVKVEQRLLQAHRQLERLNPLHALVRQQEKLKKMRLILERHREHMLRSMTFKLNDSTHRLKNLENKLQAIGPLSTLGRGYAIIRLSDGGVLRDAANVKPGEQVEAWLQKGKLRLRVEECVGNWGLEEE